MKAQMEEVENAKGERLRQIRAEWFLLLREAETLKAQYEENLKRVQAAIQDLARREQELLNG